MVKFLKIFISLKTTVACLAWLTILIFVGTIYQASHGLDASQKVFFFSWFLPPCFPGGMTTMALLTVNLIASLIVHFRFGWRMTGLLIVHCGLLLMMIGGVFIYYSSKESSLRLKEGQSTNMAEHHKIWELAIATSDDSIRKVHAVDTNRLQPGDQVRFEELGITVNVRNNVEDAKVNYKETEDYDLSDRLITVPQRLTATDLHRWINTPGKFRRQREGGAGRSLVVDISVEANLAAFDEDAATLQENVLRECDAILAEDSEWVKSFLKSEGLEDRATFLNSLPTSAAARLVDEIDQGKLLVVLLRSAEPNERSQAILRRVKENPELARLRITPTLHSPPYDIAGFEPKPHRSKVEKRLGPLREDELDAAVAELGMSRPSRLALALQNIFGQRDERYNTIEKIEKTWKKRIITEAIDETPEKRMPGLEIDVTFDGDTNTTHRLALDGAYGTYEIDPTIEHDEKTHYFRLQKKHFELPLMVQLNDFIRTQHANKAMDKEYIAQITVRGLGENNFEQDASVEMNKPYRYQGWTFYQTSFSQSVPDMTFLTARYTSGRLLPYVSTFVVFAGLCIHFLLVLSDNNKRHERELARAQAREAKPATKETP